MAVIGASNRTAPDAHPANWLKLRRWCASHGADLYPVNPRVEELDGLACYQRVSELPRDVDVAVVLVNAETTLRVLPELEAQGVKFAVLFAAGFSEAGRAGLRQQRELERVLADASMRVVGPNTNVNIFEDFEGEGGSNEIALVTQSGHLGRAVIEASQLGLRFYRWIPTGNEVDLEFSDFVRALCAVPEVGVIAGYIEGLRNGRRFVEAADLAARHRKPIVLLRVGGTESGARAAISHTGHLAGDAAVTRGISRQFGVVAVDDLDQLREVSGALARSRPPDRGTGAAVYGISGGTAALTAEIAGTQGLVLPTLQPHTQRALRQWIPGYLPVGNPVDNGWTPSRDWRNRRILETILADRRVGLVICPVTAVYRDATDAFDRWLAELAAVAKETDKPIFVPWCPPTTSDPAFDKILAGSDLHLFRSLTGCVKAACAYFDYHRFQRRYRSTIGRGLVDRTRQAQLRRQFAGTTILLEPEAKQLLSHYGFDVGTDVVCRTEAEVVRAADTLGYPVVLKAVAPNLFHRLSEGLVILDRRNRAEVRAAYRHLRERLTRGTTAVGPTEPVRYAVSRQERLALELALGVTRDREFGAVVMLALGGARIELDAQRAFRMPPLTRQSARDVIDELGVHRLLDRRPGSTFDIDALARALCSLSVLALELPEVVELDVNPLAVTEDGRLVALDALARLDPVRSGRSSASEANE